MFVFCVPQLYLWGSPLLGEMYAYVTVFNPTIKAVTFRLRGCVFVNVDRSACLSVCPNCSRGMLAGLGSGGGRGGGGGAAVSVQRSEFVVSGNSV